MPPRSTPIAYRADYHPRHRVDGRIAAARERLALVKGNVTDVTITPVVEPAPAASPAPAARLATAPSNAPTPGTTSK